MRAITRELGLVACQPWPYGVTTIAGQEAPNTPDLVGRDFTAAAPGAKLVGDITYIHTWQGFVYLATVIDCYTKMVIGYALADHMKASLVCDAIAMAGRKMSLAKEAIFHSDKGSTPAPNTAANSASSACGHLLAGLGCAGITHWLNPSTQR